MDVSHPPIHELKIPKFLCDRAKKVRSQSKRLIKAALDADSWAPMRDLECVTLGDAPMMLVLRGPPLDNADDQDNVMLYPFAEELCNASTQDDWRRWSDVLRLTARGMDEFWVCLCALGGSPVLIPERLSRDAEVASTLLPLFMRWWTVFCDLQARFYSGQWLVMPWPHWASRILTMLPDLGIQSDCRTPEDVEQVWKQWCAENFGRGRRS